jgi:phage protein U
MKLFNLLGVAIAVSFALIPRPSYAADTPTVLKCKGSVFLPIEGRRDEFLLDVSLKITPSKPIVEIESGNVFSNMFVIVRVTDTKYYLISPDEMGKSSDYSSTLDRTDGSLFLMQGKEDKTRISFNGKCSIAKTIF